MLSKNQILAVSSAILLTLVLYFGFGKVPKQVSAPEKQDNKNVSMILQASKEAAKSKLDKEKQSRLQILEGVLAATKNDATKVESLKELASFWYDTGQPEVSAYYAEQVSDLLNDKESWQITGTTFRIALAGATDEKLKDVCKQKAIRAFEKAISLDSANVNYKMQLAMVYVESPPEDNPMKGILMLRDLNTRYPENADVNIQLGRLAIQTGQFEKAVERLEKAAELSPETPSIFCLLADAYKGMGDTKQAEQAEKKCRK